MGTPLKPADRFPRRALTVAAAVSLVAAPAFAGAAHAADPVKKAIKIRPLAVPSTATRGMPAELLLTDAPPGRPYSAFPIRSENSTSQLENSHSVRQ